MRTYQAKTLLPLSCIIPHPTGLTPGHACKASWGNSLQLLSYDRRYSNILCTFSQGKHIVCFGHVQPISLSNEVRWRAGKKESEHLMSRIIQGKVFWHAVLLLGVGMAEKKQHCFHLELRAESLSTSDCTYLRRKTAGYFLSLDFSVYFVYFTSSQGLSQGRKVRGTVVSCHAGSEFVNSS